MLNLQQYLCNLFPGCPAGVLFCVSAGFQLLLMSSNGGKGGGEGGGRGGRGGVGENKVQMRRNEWQTEGSAEAEGEMYVY